MFIVYRRLKKGALTYPVFSEAIVIAPDLTTCR